jgi:DNA-binding transcriptional regulator YdaS (Cro superfamily)
MIFVSLKQWAFDKTDVEAARILKVSQPFFNQMKNGMARPSPELAVKMEQITGVPFRTLLLSKKKKLKKEQK